MCSGGGDEQLRSTGFPIRKSPDRSLVADSPGLIAGSYVLHRLLVPRHPPCALNNLATTDDARVHYAVLKIRAGPVPNPSPIIHTGKRFDEELVQARETDNKHPCPQDSTACPAPSPPVPAFHPENGCTNNHGQ